MVRAMSVNVLRVPTRRPHSCIQCPFASPPSLRLQQPRNRGAVFPGANAVSAGGTRVLAEVGPHNVRRMRILGAGTNLSSWIIPGPIPFRAASSTARPLHGSRNSGTPHR